MAALLGSGIKANKNLSADKKGWEVRIAESDFPRAMSILESRGLPRRESMTMGEIFKREGFATSATQQKALRSEEHTSELQSLLRISYAVFCLNKKIA